MIKRLKIEKRRSEIRSRLNEIRGLAEAEVTEEIRAEQARLGDELAQSETELRDAIAEEERDAELRGSQANGDGESAEHRALIGRAGLAGYIAAAAEMRAVTGAGAELNEHMGIGLDRVPLAILAGEDVEVRTTTNAETAMTPRRWIDRLFAETMARYIGVTFDSVATGVAAYPVTTAGVTALQRGRGQAPAAGSQAWTVGVTEMKPTRLPVTFTYSVEDAARLPGLEAALMRDARMALAEGLDKAIFVGDAGANEDRADIAGLSTATGVVEKTIAAASFVGALITQFDDFPGAIASLIDGKHATSMDDLAMVASVPANEWWARTVLKIDNTEDASVFKTQAMFLRDLGITWRVRDGLAADNAAGAFPAFIGRRRGIEGAAVAAVWDSASLIRDPYSGAAKGEIALTLNTLWAFKLPRPASFARVKLT